LLRIAGSIADPLPRRSVRLALRPASRRAGLICSGPIPEATAGDTWKDIDNALIHGLRGFRRGQSLPQLLAHRRGARNLHTIPRLTIKTIRRWIEEHHGATGRWPTVYSGPVAGQPGENWHMVNSALDKGLRGLPGGSSLAKVLRKHFGVVDERLLPSIETWDCSGNYCWRCLLCVAHCRCPSEGEPLAAPVVATQSGSADKLGPASRPTRVSTAPGRSKVAYQLLDRAA
jgi:hypothetical protein